MVVGADSLSWSGTVVLRGDGEVTDCYIPVFNTIEGGVLKYIMQTYKRFYKNKDKPWHNFVHHDKVLECSTRIIKRQSLDIFLSW